MDQGLGRRGGGGFGGFYNMGNMSEGILSEGRGKIENHQILNIINLFNLKMGPCRISGLFRGILKIKFIVPTFLVYLSPCMVR